MEEHRPEDEQRDTSEGDNQQDDIGRLHVIPVLGAGHEVNSEKENPKAGQAGHDETDPQQPGGYRLHCVLLPESLWYRGKTAGKQLGLVFPFGG